MIHILRETIQGTLLKKNLCGNSFLPLNEYSVLVQLPLNNLNQAIHKIEKLILDYIQFWNSSQFENEQLEYNYSLLEDLSNNTVQLKLIIVPGEHPTQETAKLALDFSEGFKQ